MNVFAFIWSFTKGIIDIYILVDWWNQTEEKLNRQDNIFKYKHFLYFSNCA